MNPKERADSVPSRFQGWFVADGKDLVFRSALAPAESIDAHLKWFYMMLGRERKFIRQLEAAGVQAVICVSVRGRSLSIDAESLLLAHQLHLKTDLRFRP